ncbi:hypothetical protein Tco_1417706 [Tanacetum coccineum]
MVVRLQRKPPQESCKRGISATKLCYTKKATTTTTSQTSSQSSSDKENLPSVRLPQKVRKGKPSFQLEDEFGSTSRSERGEEAVTSRDPSIIKQLPNCIEVVGKGKGRLTEEK